MPTIQRYTRTVIQPRAVANTVDAGAIGRAAAPFEAVSTAADFGAQLAIKEKQAHDATQLNESVLNYKKDLIDLDDQLRQENLSTPQGYSELYSQRAEELRTQYEKSMGGAVKENFSMTAKELNLLQYDNALSWQRAQGAEVMGQRIDNSVEAAKTLAYRGGNIDELLKDVDATTVAASTFVSADKLFSVQSTSARGVVSAAIAGLIDRGEYDKAQQILDYGKYDDVLGADGLDKATDALFSKRKATNTQKLSDNYKIFNQIFEMGGDYSEQQASDLKQLAIDAGNESVAKDIELKMAVKPQIDAFVKEPLDNQVGAIKQAEQSFLSEKTPEASLRYNQFVKALQAKQTALNSGNGFQYYQDIGVIGKFVPVNFQDPNNVTQSYAERRQAQAIVSNHDGVSIPLFSKQEAQQLAQVYSETPAKQKFGYLSSIANTLEDNDAQDLAAIVAQDMPSLAGAMSIIKDNPMMAELAIIGSGRKKLVGDKELQINLQAKYGTAIQDPEAFNSIIPLVSDVYAEKSVNTDAPDVFDQDIFDDITESILGNPISIGDSEVLPFRKADREMISDGEFERLVANTNIEFLSKTFGDVPHIAGRPATNEDLQSMINNWSLVTVGDGKYELRNSNDPNQVALDSKRQPYIFDYKAVLQTGAIETRGNIARGWQSVTEPIGEFLRPIPEGE